MRHRAIKDVPMVSQLVERQEGSLGSPARESMGFETTSSCLHLMKDLPQELMSRTKLFNVIQSQIYILLYHFHKGQRDPLLCFTGKEMKTSMVEYFCQHPQMDRARTRTQASTAVFLQISTCRIQPTYRGWHLCEMQKPLWAPLYI